MKESKEKVHKTVYVVFISLLLDLLAFTMILPLLPSLLDHYKEHDSTGLYTWLSRQIYFFQELVGAPSKFNSVLFGGVLGSMFSFLQFVASPIIGGISDIVGRKIVMIVCMVCTLHIVLAEYDSGQISGGHLIFLCVMGIVKQPFAIYISSIYWRYQQRKCFNKHGHYYRCVHN